MSAATKVVISECYGGFGISVEASREYLRRKGHKWTEDVRSLYTTFNVVGVDHWYGGDLDRTDATLIAIIEEMGDAANGSHANLVIHELPKGTQYLIDEYDGFESIQYRDNTEWSIA